MLRSLPVPDDGFRLEPIGGGVKMVRRDFVPPLPAGSYVIRVFRIAGYDRDCDGSAMARLDAVDRHGRATGWTANAIGLYADSALVVDEPGELWAAAERPEVGA